MAEIVHKSAKYVLELEAKSQIEANRESRVLPGEFCSGRTPSLEFPLHSSGGPTRGRER